MLNARTIKLLCAVSLLGACTHLQDVRDFASESANLSAYPQAVDYTFEGYARSEPFLLPDNRDAEKANAAARQASRDSLIGLYKLSSAYMTTLAKLAGADTFNTGANIDKLAKAIKEAPSLGVQPATVDAYTKLVHILSKWALEAAQEKAVQQMVREGGDDFEKVISGMGDVVRILRKIHDNEQKTVINNLDMMIQTTPQTPGNYLALALARDRLAQKRADYARGDALYVEAAKGIKAIQDGHRVMTDNLDRLDAKEVADRLRQLRDDIKSVRQALARAGM